MGGPEKNIEFAQIDQPNERPATSVPQQLDRLKQEIDVPVPELTAKNLDQLIFKNKKIVILEVGEEWCVPCKKFAQVLKEFKALFPDSIEIVSFQRDAKNEMYGEDKPNPDLRVIQRRIPFIKGNAIPRFIIFKGGKERKKEEGMPLAINLLNTLRAQGLSVSAEQEEKAIDITLRLQPMLILQEIDAIPANLRDRMIVEVIKRTNDWSELRTLVYYNSRLVHSKLFVNSMLEKIREYMAKSADSNDEKLNNIADLLFIEEEFANHPSLEEIVLDLARNKSEYLIANFSAITKGPLAKRILEIVADRNPRAFFEHYRRYIRPHLSDENKKYGDNLYERIAKGSTAQ